MWEKTVAVNLMGLIRMSYLALEHMSKLSGGRGGVIVNIASLADYGIRFNVLCPSFVQTDLFVNTTSNLGQLSHLADAAKQIEDKLGVLSTSEVAECVLELVKDETKNGDALLLIPKGKQYITFPSFS
ncbi:hypothetical protein F7725_006972 [Dissostichus mawsoni]|uniref:Uncharacterized protein n=1 Tax=Dissostichus mawsoni TaxID=36200 RepID=A0A7J5XVE8_DISMA|nr:hypothetical protein F7725_006972 [Dissostichus mawsoni]